MLCVLITKMLFSLSKEMTSMIMDYFFLKMQSCLSYLKKISINPPAIDAPISERHVEEDRSGEYP